MWGVGENLLNRVLLNREGRGVLLLVLTRKGAVC